MKDKILTKLPLHETGVNKGKVNWKRTINMKLDVLYKNKIYNNINIIENKNRYLTVKYKNNITKISITNFSSGHFGYVLGIKTTKYFYKIGDIIENKNGKIKVLKHIRIKRKNDKTAKGYLVRCLNCKYTNGEFYEFKILESDLKNGVGCACCARNKIIYGINDLYTQNSNLLKFFVDQEEAKMVGYGSTKKIYAKCPLCGNIKKISPNTLTQSGLGCICGEGKSYPEKFLYSVLKQLHINFETEKSFKWCKKIKNKNSKLCGDKRYDFYFETNNKRVICETHGAQHYYNTDFGSIGSNTKNLQEEQKNDAIKKQLAQENGIDYYIVVDCRKSELKWIKNSIINSRLNYILDLNEVNWVKADEFAQYSNVKKKVCDYKNNNPKAKTSEISRVFNINQSTICRYLKFGDLHGWCKYDPKIETKIANSKPIKCLEIGKCFPSIKRCCEQMEEMFQKKFISQEISKACKGKAESYKGYTFRYIK